MLKKFFVIFMNALIGGWCAIAAIWLFTEGAQRLNEK